MPNAHSRQLATQTSVGLMCRFTLKYVTFAVQPLAHQVRHLAQRKNVRAAIQRHAVVEAKAFAGRHFLERWAVDSRIFDGRHQCMGVIVVLDSLCNFSVQQDVGRPKDKEQHADVAIQGEKRDIHSRQIVRLNQAVLVEQQSHNHGDAASAQRAQMELDHQHNEA